MPPKGSKAGQVGVTSHARPPESLWLRLPLVLQFSRAVAGLVQVTLASVLAHSSQEGLLSGLKALNKRHGVRACAQTKGEAAAVCEHLQRVQLD